MKQRFSFKEYHRQKSKNPSINILDAYQNLNTLPPNIAKIPNVSNKEPYLMTASRSNYSGRQGSQGIQSRPPMLSETLKAILLVFLLVTISLGFFWFYSKFLELAK